MVPQQTKRSILISGPDSDAYIVQHARRAYQDERQAPFFITQRSETGEDNGVPGTIDIKFCPLFQCILPNLTFFDRAPCPTQRRVKLLLLWSSSRALRTRRQNS